MIRLCADVEVQSGQKAYWFKLDENGELVGGIAKFLQERKEAVIEKLGLKKGDFVGLTAGNEGRCSERGRRIEEIPWNATVKHI